MGHRARWIIDASLRGRPGRRGRTRRFFAIALEMLVRPLATWVRTRDSTSYETGLSPDMTIVLCEDGCLDFAGDVAIGVSVASLADAGMTSSVDITGGVTIGLTSLAVAGVASPGSRWW